MACKEAAKNTIMKKIITFFLALAFTANLIHAQNTYPYPATGSVGIGVATPYASALFEVRSTTKGFLPPRMTTTQRNAIATPTTGLLIYQTDNIKGLYYYSGS